MIFQFSMNNNGTQSHPRAVIRLEAGNSGLPWQRYVLLSLSLSLSLKPPLSPGGGGCMMCQLMRICVFTIRDQCLHLLSMHCLLGLSKAMDLNKFSKHWWIFLGFHIFNYGVSYFLCQTMLNRLKGYNRLNLENIWLWR